VVNVLLDMNGSEKISMDVHVMIVEPLSFPIGQLPRTSDFPHMPPSLRRNG